MIYLDNNATTRPAPEVLAAAEPWLREHYGNPSAAYALGVAAARALDLARERVAALIGADPVEVVFTASGSEAVNTAIIAALAAAPQRREIVTTAVEHPCVLSFCQWFAAQGYTLHVIGVDEHGRLRLDEFEARLSERTALVSCMWANNETGNLYPVQRIAELAKARGAVVHIDAVQAAGKVPVTLHDLPTVDYASFSAHKFHGLKGCGALYVRRGSTFRPLLMGGHQERGRRAGTENVPGIVAMGRAAELARESLIEDMRRESELRDALEEVLLRIPNACRNGDAANRVPNTTNISFPGIEAKELLSALDRAGIAASAGSACTTGSLEPSHVLRAMNLDDVRAKGALRLSLSRFTTREEITRAADALADAVRCLSENSEAMRREASRQPGVIHRATH